jgi:hypothetical protein
MLPDVKSINNKQSKAAEFLRPAYNSYLVVNVSDKETHLRSRRDSILPERRMIQRTLTFNVRSTRVYRSCVKCCYCSCGVGVTVQIDSPGQTATLVNWMKYTLYYIVRADSRGLFPTIFFHQSSFRRHPREQKLQNSVTKIIQIDQRWSSIVIILSDFTFLLHGKYCHCSSKCKYSTSRLLLHIPNILIKFSSQRNVLFAVITLAIGHFYFVYFFLSLYVSQDLITILCTYFVHGLSLFLSQIQK